MSCTTSSASAVITEAQFNSIGFFKVSPVTGDIETYVMDQYKLIYSITTMRVEVWYTAGTSIVEHTFAGIVPNFATLVTQLTLNGIIV